MLSIFKEIGRWIYWHPCRFLVQRLPLRAGYKMAGLLVPLFTAVSIKDRKMISEGIERMYGGKVSGRELDRIVKGTFKNTLYSSVEVLWYPKFTKDICEGIFTFRGLDNLNDGLKKKRGVVLLHCHFGNAHMIMPSVGYKGYKLNQIASRIPPEPLKGFIGRILYMLRKDAYKIKLSYKEKLPVNFIYTDVSIREVFRALQRNEIIAIGLDGREGTRPEAFDFLGRKATFYTGTMKLIQKAKPVVLPTFHLRDGDRHVLVIEKPVDLTETGEEANSQSTNMRNILDMFEGYIYKYPDHYAKVFTLGKKFFLN